MLFLPLRDACALGPLCLGYAGQQGMPRKEPLCSPRSSLLRLVAHTPRTQDPSEPLPGPDFDRNSAKEKWSRSLLYCIKFFALESIR